MYQIKYFHKIINNSSKIRKIKYMPDYFTNAISELFLQLSPCKKCLQLCIETNIFEIRFWKINKNQWKRCKRKKKRILLSDDDALKQNVLNPLHYFFFQRRSQKPEIFSRIRYIKISKSMTWCCIFN